MADPMITGDYFLDGFPIKSEPISMDNNMFGTSSSAGVPIPQRRGNDLCDARDFGFDINNPSSGIFPDTPYTSSSFYSGQSVWSPRSDIKMEDDDIFQVDKADLIQGPTLAELNANDDTLLEDLNFDDLVLPEEAKFLLLTPKEDQTHAMNIPFTVATSFPPNSGSFFRDLDRDNRTMASSLKIVPIPMKGVVEEKPVLEELEVASAVVGSPVMESPGPVGSPAVLSPHSPGLSPHSPQLSPGQQLSPRGVSPHKPTTLQSLLMKNSLQGGTVGIPGRSNSVGNKSRPAHISRLMTPVSRLSSSAPTHLGLEQIWARREPRPHLLSTSSLAEATSTSSISTGGVLSPEAHDFSLDEGFDSEDDTDHDEDDSSDAESSDGEGGSKSGSSKKDRYFWQYNVQAKGPKGQRLILRNKLEDPHYLDEVTDPVFSPGCSLQGIKHSGKARKGDGNDLTPNPKKLSAIGKELDKLSRTINEMTPVNELPFDIRQKSRKEKNKLASRACRLKKKAQHEANKIKLYGLESEHRRLMAGIMQMKQMIVSRVTQSPAIPPPPDPSKVADKIVKQATKIKIAGQTTEFVNRTLDKLKAGIPGGGLEELQHYPT